MLGKTICLATFALMLIVTGCTATQKPSSTSNENVAPTTAPVPSIQIFFPRQEETKGERAVMEALISGTLVLADNCIRVDPVDSDDSYLLIWPPDFDVSLENGKIAILNGDGEILAHIGDKVYIGGGGIPSPSVYDQVIQEQVPPQCTKPYWIIGDVFTTINPLNKP
jgi:hypothetical protein